MTGVTFQTPLRFFDGTDVVAGIHALTFGAPAGTSQVLLQVMVVPNASGATGVVMSHACNVAPDPSTDVILPIDPTSGAATNQVYATVPGGACLTTTVATARLVVDIDGWVMDTGGASYVDTPFTFATTIVGPVTAQPIDFSTLGVPADAAGVAVWLDAISSTSGFATVYPCNQPRPVTSNAIWTADQPTTGLVAGVATVGSQLCMFISDGASIDVSVDGYYRVGSVPTSTSAPQVRFAQENAPGFVATTPVRMFDTRTAGIPIIGGQSYRLDLSPYVPFDASAVVMNVTATQPAAAGFVTVYPCDGVRPETSSLNFVAGQTVPNLVTVDAGASLQVCFFASVSTHLLADLSGYYLFGGGDGFAPSPPVRMLDTRGMASQIIGPAKVAGHSTFDFDVSSFVPADATAVVFNLTATDVVGPGFVTVYPCGQLLPTASNLNVLPDQTVPNLVTVALSPSKHVCLFTTSNLNLIADLAGWYSPSATSGFVAIQPTRWVDTRADFSPFLPAGLVTPIDFATDFPDATAMVFNLTATQVISAGYLTAFPCGGDPPNASNVNFVAGQTVPNMAIASVDATGALCVFNSERTHWILDVSGFFTSAPLFFSFFPAGTDNL